MAEEIVTPLSKKRDSQRPTLSETVDDLPLHPAAVLGNQKALPYQLADAHSISRLLVPDDHADEMTAAANVRNGSKADAGAQGRKGWKADARIVIRHVASVRLEAVDLPQTLQVATCDQALLCE